MVFKAPSAPLKFLQMSLVGKSGEQVHSREAPGSGILSAVSEEESPSPWAFPGHKDQGARLAELSH